MDLLHDVYWANPSFWNVVIALLVFGGLGRIAFWSKTEGMRIGAPLAVGLALLLTVALLTWAEENHRCIQEYGPWAAIIVCQAILLLGWRAWTKSSRI